MFAAGVVVVVIIVTVVQRGRVVSSEMYNLVDVNREMDELHSPLQIFIRYDSAYSWILTVEIIRGFYFTFNLNIL